MKQTNIWQRFLAVTALPSLMAITFGFPIPAVRASPNIRGMSSGECAGRALRPSRTYH
jgi:hypothetical protein